MKDEKQIEEMAKIIGIPCYKRIDAYDDGSQECPLPRPCSECTAELLYNAGYRKQSENTVELPCKVNDTLYVDYEGAVYPVQVNAIRLDNKKNNCRICVWGTFHIYEHYSHNYKATFPFNSIGKTVFLTKEEAEKALAARK